jgi:beta-phosphoglucomutase-like phosphatase (HAD superfamily)
VIRTAGTTPAKCALITASVTSVDAARNARAHSIGYATTAEAHELLATAGAECIVPSLADLTLRLRPRPMPK